MNGILDWSHARPGSWYHCSIAKVSGSSGRSSVAAAAYALGTRLQEEGRDAPHDYSRKGGIIVSFTLAPEAAPEWAVDPRQLWQAAERADRRINSVTARVADLALPDAVTAQEREAIARDFAQELVDRYGVAVSAALHEPNRHGDDRNWHAHFVWTTRELGADGFGKKTRVLDDQKTGPEEITHLRHFAADRINQALEAAGSDERVDARSLMDQGIDRAPSTHLGPTAADIERRKHARSERGDRNREIAADNDRLAELAAELAALDAEIVALEEKRLDERYGIPDRGEPGELGAPQSPAGAAARAGESGDGIPRTREEARAALDEEAAPFEAYLMQNREIVYEAEAVTWWQRAGVYGWEKARQAVETVRGYWQNFVESRRGQEPDSPDQDGPTIER